MAKVNVLGAYYHHNQCTHTQGNISGPDRIESNCDGPDRIEINISGPDINLSDPTESTVILNGPDNSIFIPIFLHQIRDYPFNSHGTMLAG